MAFYPRSNNQDSITRNPQHPSCVPPQSQQHSRQRHLRRAEERAARRPASSKLDQINSVSNIDEISRVLFPFAFVCINLLYWYTFLSHTEWSQDGF